MYGIFVATEFPWARSIWSAVQLRSEIVLDEQSLSFLKQQLLLPKLDIFQTTTGMNGSVNRIHLEEARNAGAGVTGDSCPRRWKEGQVAEVSSQLLLLQR